MSGAGSGIHKVKELFSIFFRNIFNLNSLFEVFGRIPHALTMLGLSACIAYEGQIDVGRTVWLKTRVKEGKEGEGWQPRRKPYDGLAGES